MARGSIPILLSHLFEKLTYKITQKGWGRLQNPDCFFLHLIFLLQPYTFKNVKNNLERFVQFKI